LVLKQITLFHPSPNYIELILSAMDIAGPITIKFGEPAIQFTFKTPNGNNVVFSENCLAEVWDPTTAKQY
jgi:hypothetical protein